MENAHVQDVRSWLERAASGDAESWYRLIELHHQRLHRMVAARMDTRLRARFDPSDVLQNAYLEAALHLGEFVRDPSLSFGMWLRGLVSHQLARLVRYHLGSQRRDPRREVSADRQFPEMAPAALPDAHQGPSEEADRAEMCQHLHAMVDRLQVADRDVLRLHHFQQLSLAETAHALGISKAAAGKRYGRALTRLRSLLIADPWTLEGWQLGTTCGGADCIPSGLDADLHPCQSPEGAK